jgi:hypothetical protein
MMKLEKLTLVLASALLLGTTGAAKAVTFTAPVSASNSVMLIADDSQSAGLSAGDTLTVKNGGEYFTTDEQYEVQADENDGLFVEDDQGDTWSIVSVSEDGNQIQLQYDGQTLSGDDVDS